MVHATAAPRAAHEHTNVMDRRLHRRGLLAGTTAAAMLAALRGTGLSASAAAQDAGEPTRGGKAVTTYGPYLETKELLGGITIVEVADLDEALAWARKGAEVCRMPMEVREIFFNPAPEED